MNLIITIFFIICTNFIGGLSFAKDGMTGTLAGFFFSHTAKRILSDQNVQGTRSQKSQYLFYTAGFCYVKDVVCIGGKYLQGSLKTETRLSSSSSLSSSEINYNGYGVTIGYYGKEISANFSYIFDGKREENDDSQTDDTRATYPAINSTIIDIGYGIKFKKIKVGPMVSFMRFEYEEKSSGSGSAVELSSKESDSFIMPHFAVWIDF